MEASQSEIEREEHMEENEREATELRCHESGTTPVVHRQPTMPSHGWSLMEIISKTIPKPVSRFWRQQISASVPHVACRDHLGMCKFSKPAITWTGLPSNWLVFLFVRKCLVT